MWLVSALKKDLSVTIMGCIKEKTPLTWASGMTGAIPVFETREDALKYAQGDLSLLKEVKFTGEELTNE